jgi:hypothetical protein
MSYKFNPFTGNFDDAGSAPIVTTVDTKENILALAPTSPQTAFATDTAEFFVYDGANWQVASVKLSVETPDPDIGFTQDNDKQGYGEDYIQGKKATDFALGDFTDTPYNGALKLDQINSPMTLEIFARGIWNQIFYDFQMINGDLEHMPETFTIDVRSGNSNELGLNDVPIVQEYSVDIGAYPYPTVIDGGTL